MSVLRSCQMVPAPPRGLECALWTLAEGTLIHRIHDRRFAGDSFNPGIGASRFAPFEIGGSRVPTSYAATSLECAIFESIFHDIDPAGRFKSVRWSALEALDYSVLRVNRDVKLAKLFTPDLTRWKISRTQLIDTPRSHYASTRLWSPAIHEAPQKPQGMIWVSRAYDEEKAMILFGTRTGPGCLSLVSTVEVTRDVHCLGTLAAEAERADILIAR